MVSEGESSADVKPGFPTVLWEQVYCQQHPGWPWPLCHLVSKAVWPAAWGRAERWLLALDVFTLILAVHLMLFCSWALGRFHPFTQQWFVGILLVGSWLVAGQEPWAALGPARLGLVVIHAAGVLSVALHGLALRRPASWQAAGTAPLGHVSAAPHCSSPGASDVGRLYTLLALLHIKLHDFTVC